MENYIKNYKSYNKSVVYNFNTGNGGIGDNIKFFMYILKLCMQANKRLYYKKNNIFIEEYIKLKYDIMYVVEDINKLDAEIVEPYMYYGTVDYDCVVDINEVFYFTDVVKINKTYLFPHDIPYISIHLRLGDKYLETDVSYVHCTWDVREFSEKKIDEFIEKNSNENIFFCCDNESYKIKLKKKHNNIIISNCDIGHSSLSNTTNKQVLDAITEFYILTNSKLIFGASNSGFSIVASKFNNIPLIL